MRDRQCLGRPAQLDRPSYSRRAFRSHRQIGLSECAVKISTTNELTDTRVYARSVGTYWTAPAPDPDQPTGETYE